MRPQIPMGKRFCSPRSQVRTMHSQVTLLSMHQKLARYTVPTGCSSHRLQITTVGVEKVRDRNVFSAAMIGAVKCSLLT